MSLLEVRDLRKSFDGVAAVDGVSFSVDPGEVFGLLGPNGAGKTTTMMMLSGLVTPDAGDVQLDGEPFGAGFRSRRRLLGVVPQELAIYPDLSGEENLRFFGRLYGLKGSQLEEQVRAALDQVGLDDQGRKAVRHYSGGMKRRLNFAAALLHEPRVLVLDEPTVGVDPQSRSHLLDCVRDLVGKGLAVLYASHYMEEVEAICSRVGIMDHGRMLANDTLPALLERLSTHLELHLSPLSEENVARFRKHAPPETVLTTEPGRVRVRLEAVRGSDDLIVSGLMMQLLQAAREVNATVLMVRSTEPSLETLFLELTGRRLRD